MPVEMVVGDVRDRRAIQRQRIGEMQLERAELHAQRVVVRIDRGVGHRLADVADRRCNEAIGAQHGRGHLGRGRLAVRAGDAHPRGGAAGAGAVHAQPPRELDLAVHGDASALGFEDERRARVEHRRRHDDVGRIPVDVVERMQVGLRLMLVHADYPRCAGTQHFHHAAAGYTQTGHQNGLVTEIHIVSLVIAPPNRRTLSCEPAYTAAVTPRCAAWSRHGTVQTNSNPDRDTQST